LIAAAAAGFFWAVSIFNTSPYYDCLPLERLGEETIEHGPVPDDAVCYTALHETIFFKSYGISNRTAGMVAFSILVALGLGFLVCIRRKRKSSE